MGRNEEKEEGGLQATTMVATRRPILQQEMNRHKISRGRAADGGNHVYPPGRHWHWPVVQDSVRVLQLMPQAPQWLALVLVSISQPSAQSAPSALQLSKPEPAGSGRRKASVASTIHTCSQPDWS